MHTQLTVSARSSLGRFLALLVVSAVLLMFGMYLVTDGGFFTKTIPQTLSPSASLGGASAVAQPSAMQTELAAITERLKRYERQDLLFGYGVAIFVGFFLVGAMGRAIRSYGFRFQTRGASTPRAVVERREMWFFFPLWILIWLAMALVLMVVLAAVKPLPPSVASKQRFLDFVGAAIGVGRPITLSIRGWLALLIPPAVLVGAWSLFPDLLEKTIFARRGRRVPLWVVAWPVLIVLVLLATALPVMFKSLLPVAGALGYAWTLSIPAGLLLALLIPPLPIVLLWVFAPRVAAFRVYVPGFRWRVTPAAVKRMEIQSSPDGAAVLVLTLKDERSWTVSAGTPKRLQRLGGILSRMLGLERRDLLTWS